MNPITHFLVGWTALERWLPSRRDKALVCCSGVVPDLDGLGIVVDFATRCLGYPPTDYYQQFHRIYGHGVPAALLVTALVGLSARDKRRSAALAFVAVHLHFLCDLLGSRGSGADDIWPIYYLAPFTTWPAWSFPYQWPLVGWQNLTISALLMGIAMWRATGVGYSPVALVSVRADAVFVAVVRGWRERIACRIHRQRSG